MNWKVARHAWELKIGDPTAKAVLMAYVAHASDDGRNIYPSVATVAKKTEFSERTVQRATARLEKIGVLIADGLSEYQTNKWRFNWDWIPEDVTEGRGDTVSEGGDTVSEGGDTVSEGGDTVSKMGDRVTPDPIIDPIIDPITETEDTDTYVSVDADASKPPRSFDLEQLDLLRGKVNLTEKEQAQVLWPILAPYYLKQDLPEIPEVQKVARQVGGALRLGEIVAEHWGRPVIGDPLDFFRALAKERSPNGHAKQSTPTADSWPPWVQFGYDPPEDDELVPAGCEEEVDDVLPF